MKGKKQLLSLPLKALIQGIITLQLFHQAYNLIIRPKPCYNEKGEQGTCMFVLDCIARNGSHLGSCSDRYLIGSCCVHDTLNKVPGENISLDVTTTDFETLKDATTGTLYDIQKPTIAVTLSISSSVDNDVSSGVSSPLTQTSSSYASSTAYPLSSNLTPISIIAFTNQEENSVSNKQPVTTIKTPLVITTHNASSLSSATTTILPTIQTMIGNISTTQRPVTAVNRSTTSKTTPSTISMIPLWTHQTDTTTSKHSITPVPPTITKSSTTHKTMTTKNSSTTTSMTSNFPILSTTTRTTKIPRTTTIITREPLRTMSPFAINMKDNTFWDFFNRQHINQDKDCGIPPLHSRIKIVGGKQTVFGTWPWQVSVRWISTSSTISYHRCGGAILNKQWIATAGHCVDDLLFSQIRIRMGDHDFTNVMEPYPYVEREIRQIIVHPAYNFFTYENDLALVKLEEPIEYRPHIVPICLPPTDDFLVGKNASIIGWGRLIEVTRGLSAQVVPNLAV
ncbi:uncharacterized protein LOC143231998 isoform X2 [Tachypleus tridentatus]|uniref:uncharacterized protein LOC143231998 isoform X2 n=1 Tax=Tachypleus tridentatus TaxID=6853 RepID=UPI003FD65B2B